MRTQLQHDHRWKNIAHLHGMGVFSDETDKILLKKVLSTCQRSKTGSSHYEQNVNHHKSHNNFQRPQHGMEFAFLGLIITQLPVEASVFFLLND